MQLPKLSKRQKELLEELVGLSSRDIHMATSSVKVNIPDGLTFDQRCHLIVYQAAAQKQLTKLLKPLIDDGICAIQDFSDKYYGSADEIDAPLWMETLCEHFMSEYTNDEINEYISEYYDKQFSIPRGIDDTIEFFNDFFESHYEDFVKFITKIYHEKSSEALRLALSTLGVGSQFDSILQVNEASVLDTLTQLSSAELSKLAAIALENIETNDFKRSLMKLEVKTTLINAGNDLLKFNHLAFKKLQSEMLLLNWLNNVATDEEDAQVFAEDWFKKLTGIDPDKSFVKKVYTVEVPTNRKYGFLADDELSKLGDVVDMNLTPSEFEWASAMVEFSCARYIVGQECNYFEALKDLQTQKGRCYSSLIIDFLHVLAEKNKFFAGQWLMKMAK